MKDVNDANFVIFGLNKNNYFDETYLQPSTMNVSNVSDVINATTELFDNATAVFVERSWIYYIPGPFICAFGMTCNVLNLFVLSNPLLKESPYVYLTALAISDFTLLAFSFGHLIMSNIEQTFFKSFYDVYLFFAFGNVFFNASVWLIVLMTIERMLFVIWPLKMRSSRKKARKAIVAVFVACALINIPRYFCYKIKPFGKFFYPYRTQFMESTTYFAISWFHAIIINFVPLVILAVTNTTLLLALHKASKTRMSLNAGQQESASRKEQTRLTRTLVSVVVVFFLTVTPSAFVDDPISFALFGEGRSWREFLMSQPNQNFIYISNLLLFLNSSLNFILYCAFNRKFRQAMKERCLCLLPYRRGTGSLSISTKSQSTKGTSV